MGPEDRVLGRKIDVCHIAGKAAVDVVVGRRLYAAIRRELSLRGGLTAPEELEIRLRENALQNAVPDEFLRYRDWI